MLLFFHGLQLLFSPWSGSERPDWSTNATEPSKIWRRLFHSINDMTLHTVQAVCGTIRLTSHFTYIHLDPFGASPVVMKMSCFFSQADIFTQVWQDGTGHFECYPLLCCLLKALRFGSRCLYKLKAVLNAAPAQLMRGSLQNLHEMMLSNWWHKNVACNPPVQTLGVNMPAPPFSQRLLPVQTVSLPSLPLSKNTMTALRYSPPESLAACDQWNNQEQLW